jgi:N-acetylglutamate synthase-like GNAT family acetyltransferase
MKIEIRHATLQDFCNVMELVPRSARALQSAYYTKTAIDAALELVCGIDNLIQKNTFVVAEYQGKIVGCGGWSVETSQKNTHAELRGFFVHPDFARRGIATRIIQYCEKKCRGIEADRLYLTSTLAGEPFYIKNGFSTLEKIMKVLSSGENFTLIRMQKNISDPITLKDISRG